MAVSTFSTPSVNVNSSGVTSPAIPLSSGVVDVEIELTSTGDWSSAGKVGSGYFTFGVEYSTASSNGPYSWLCHVPGDGADPSQLVIGQLRAKDGGMPDCGIGADELVVAGGGWVRLRAQTIAIPNSTRPANPTVRVGAHLTVTSAP